MSEQGVPDEISEDGIPVDLPSGAQFLVLNEDERDYVRDRVQQYMDQLKLENVSDLAELDRIVSIELLCHRWSLWLSRQKDYFGDDIDESAIRRTLGDMSKEIRLIKGGLGVDKVTRDRTKGSESVSVYLENLRQRAKAFVYMRDEQHAESIELAQQLIALYTFHSNCTEEERKERHCTAEDIVEWIGDVFKPQFESVDIEFRKKQTIWVRDQ